VGKPVALPKQPVGVELPKNPEAKYEHRYRKPTGGIVYKYGREPVGAPA
jgi:hypothetical protein